MDRAAATFCSHEISHANPVDDGVDENQQEEGWTNDGTDNNDHKQHGQTGPDLNDSLKKEIEFSTEIAHASPNENSNEIIQDGENQGK